MRHLRDKADARQQQRRVADTIELVQSLRVALAEAAVADEYRWRLQPWWSAVQDATCVPGGLSTGLDLYAQSLGIAVAVTRDKTDLLMRSDVRGWLVASANALWKDVLVDAYFLLGVEDFAECLPPAAGSVAFDRLREQLSQPPAEPSREGPCGSAIPDIFEAFLGAFDPAGRKRRGVFYTPRPIARLIVAQVDRQLRDEFGVPDGLADTLRWSTFARQRPSPLPNGTPDGPLVTILDPALGTGVFLEEVIDLIYRRLRQRWQGPVEEEAAFLAQWNDYVHRDLLPRLFGLEIMLPACLAAYLNLAVKLAETGFGFEQPAQVEIHLINTLGDLPSPREALCAGPPDRYGAAVAAARQVAFAKPMTVIVGNPPFSGLSQAGGRWIAGLLKGTTPAGSPAANYYHVEGQALGERKLWLQDDYVKFLRFAHWKIESAGLGLVGLITNHGYLDNPTFRGVRYQLMQTFPRIDVIDLHGNRKKHEIAPSGSRDENVFAVEQGTAIGLFRRPPGVTSPGADGAGVGHCELWGSARDKLAALAAAAADGDAAFGSTIRQQLQPAPPHYLFVPRDESRVREYLQGYPLGEIMPVNVTAPVTARDGFVVAFQREELIQRMGAFRDLSVGDDWFRQRFFHTRSGKYPAGDTRGWKLPRARQRLAAEPAWAEPIRSCWYRPFDRRYVYWSREMVDWPRDDVVSHLLAGPNLALIARRQMLPTQPCNFFWIVDDLTLDGVIRSDNRGSESIFPLYLYGSEAGGPRRTANLDGGFIRTLQSRTGLAWIGDGAGDLQTGSFGPEDVLHFCHALFHSVAYRRRYADPLRADFPRVFLPRTASLFIALSVCGRCLAEAHLLRGAPAAAVDAMPEPESRIEPGYPRYAAGRVQINAVDGFQPVPREVWEFRIGGHQVCRKWLWDRRGRRLSQRECTIYAQILHAIAVTQQGMRQIDSIIDQHGGWPAAFAARPARR